MIPKCNRLTTKEIDEFFKKNEPDSNNKKKIIIHTPSFFVVVDQGDHFKAGVSISKKIYKNAVDRNRIRRTVFDALRDIGFFLLPFHLLISIKKGHTELSRDDIARETKELFEKIKNNVSPNSNIT